MSDAPRPPTATPVLVTAVLAAAAIGFAVGIRPPEAPSSVDARSYPDPNEASPVVAAPSYTGLRTQRVGPNASWFSDLTSLRAGLPAPHGNEPRTDAELEATRVARMALRAYDGAPPRIPHAIDDRHSGACIACHESGLAVDDRIAPPMSHTYLSQCTQCHVPVEQGFGGRAAESALAAATPVGGLNGFRPHEWPRRGTRAWLGAPPTVPHTLQMRERCTSCHGITGWHGVAHPDLTRNNCTQCHVPGVGSASASVSALPPPIRR